MKKRALIALGSNQGNRQKWIQNAIQQLAAVSDIVIHKTSSLYETTPVGGPRQPHFLNGAIQISTNQKPHTLLKTMQQIEKNMGRVRKSKWGPRSIDVDLIAYEGKIIRSQKLKLPHPLYHKRKFVLKPLCDIAPNGIHPVLGKKNKKLLEELTDPDQKVKIFSKWKNKQFSQFKKRKKAKSR